MSELCLKVLSLFFSKRTLVFCVYFFCNFSDFGIYNLAAQEEYFRTINSRDGLSQNSVVSMALDSNGFVWMATQDGLNKYNGDKFTIYNKYFENNTPYTELHLGKLFVESDGTLWIIPKSKIPECRSGNTGEFIGYPSLKNTTVIFQRKNKDLLFATIDGTIRILNKDKEIKHLIQMPVIKSANNAIYGITEDEKEQLWIASGNGIYKITGRDKHTVISKIPISDNKENINCFIYSFNHEIWVTTLGAGIYRKKEHESNFSKVTGFFNNIKFPENLTVYSIVAQKNGNIWFSTFAHGLFLYNADKGIAKQFLTIKRKNNWIKSNYFLSSILDKSNNVWFGSDGDGVFILENKFHFNLLSNNDAPLQYNFSQARSILRSGNDLWVGNWQNGLYRISLEHRQFDWTKYTSGASDYNLDNVIAIAENENRDIYVATPYDGLFCKTRTSDKFDRLDLSSVAENRLLGINTIKYTGDNTLYIGTQKLGLIKLITDQNKFIRYRLINDNTIKISIRCIESDEKGNLWIGFDNNGFGYFDTKANRFYHLSESKYKLPGKNIKSLKLDTSRNMIWLGTNDDGLFAVDLNNHSVSQYGVNEGLLNNTIYGIALDHKNYIWISSNKGISLLKFRKGKKLSTPEITHFTEQDGLQSLEYNTGAHFKDKNGNIYFGGINGINWFDPTLYSTSSNKSSCYISKILVNQTDFISGVETENLESIKLKHFDNNITCIIETLDLENAKKATYRYKLQNFLDKWIYSGTNNYISFTNLPSGDYVFYVSVCTDGVNWSSPTRLDIIIQTPWFKSLWFILLMFIFFFSLGYGYYYYFIRARIRNQKIKTEFQQEIDRLQVKALRNQMNPHFAFNCLNAIEHIIIKKDYPQALEYLNKFSKLLRFSLENSQENKIPLRMEINVIELYLELEKLRFEDTFEYSIIVDESVNIDRYSVPPLIIQPIVENSIKHGLIPKQKNCDIEIHIREIDRHLTFIIADNGIGRTSSQSQKSPYSINKISLGINTTVNRLKLMYEYEDGTEPLVIEDMYDEDGQPAGTVVTIKIPLSG